MVASFVVSLQYSVDELLKGFICTFEERWEAKEQDSDEHGQRRHAFAFPIWKFLHGLLRRNIHLLAKAVQKSSCCCEPTLANMLANWDTGHFALPCTLRVELSAHKGWPGTSLARHQFKFKFKFKFKFIRLSVVYEVT